MGSAREAERLLRLLRRVDLETVLADLGIEVLYTKGADGYTECPDPAHVDENPSFHVCLEEVMDERGRNRLGWFRCWSHAKGTGEELKGRNFLDLVARIDGQIWDRWPTEAERDRAALWLRENYVRRGNISQRSRAVVQRRMREEAVEPAKLVWPPSVPIQEAGREFRRYLTDARGFPMARAIDLGVRAVARAGKAKSLKWTVPAIMFPIYHEGEAVNYYARSILKRISSKNKGRYGSGMDEHGERVPVALQSRGIFWAPELPDFSKPVALTEGLLDAESVRRKIRGKRVEVPVENVLSTLGGYLHKNQARRLRGCPMVYVLGDGDHGGEDLLDSVKSHLATVTRVVDARMGEGLDPDDAPDEMVVAALQVPSREAAIRIRLRKRRLAR